MIRAVFDTNVIASGLAGYHRPASTPGALLRRWFAGDFVLVVSDHLIGEIERTLTTRYFSANTTPVDRATVVTVLRERAIWTPITVSISGVATHPEDDLVLAAAVSAGVDVLVTGDKPLQELRRYRDVTIINPRDFLTLLEESDQPAMRNDE